MNQQSYFRILGPIFLAIGVFAGNVEAQGGGPPGGDVRAIAIAPGTRESFTWEPEPEFSEAMTAPRRGPRPMRVLHIRVCRRWRSSLPIHPRCMRRGWTQPLGGQSLVYKSTNGGATWTAVNSGLEWNLATALAIDPNTSTTIYAGTVFGMFKSVNGGIGWNPINTGLTSQYIQA